MARRTYNSNTEFERRQQESKAKEMNRARIRANIAAQKADKQRTMNEIKHRQGGVR